NGLVAIEGGAWAEWGKASTPITQNALARLLKPHKVFPDDVGPEHGRRKGYRLSQFAGLFEAYLKHGALPGPDIRAAAHSSVKSTSSERRKARSSSQSCADGKSQNGNNTDALRGCAAPRGPGADGKAKEAA